jgi:hypothetical protein
MLALGMAACAETQKPAMQAAAADSNVPAPPNVDRTKCDDKGKQVITADTDGDRKPDVWKFFQTVQQNGQQVQVMTCKQVDLNHDGKIDLVSYYDDTGSQVTMDEADLDFDGKFDMTRYFVNGKKVREELDTNFDQRPDVWRYFEDEKLVRQERDTNNDGKVDEWQYYEGGKLDRIGYDTTGTGRVSKWDRAPEAEEGLPGEQASNTGANTGPAGQGPAAISAPGTPAPAASSGGKVDAKATSKSGSKK